MTNESDALRAELVEQKAHVARLESELLNLRQQHARDQKESLEHVRRACRERDEARVQRDDADLLYRGMADGLHKATAQREDARRIAGENFNKIVQLYAALEALSKGQTDVPHSDACEPTKKCGACKARDVVSFWRDRGNEAIAERDAARAQLLQSDRDIATAIGRARVAELAASGWSIRAKHLRESGEMGKPFSVNTADWSELARLAYQDAKGLLEASGSTALVGREYMSGLLQCLADALHWMHGNVSLATHMGQTRHTALTEQIGRLTVKRDDALAKLKGQEDFIRTITLERDHAQQVEVPHYCQERDDATAKLAAYAWQPIETAPKDATEILAWVNGGIFSVRWYCRDEQHWYDARSGDQCSPTHWMPLPEPPQDKA